MSSEQQQSALAAVAAALAAVASRDAGRLWIGCSGGLDSMVLLDAAARQWPAGQLRVLHINHQLSPQADHWQASVAARAAALGCPFEAVKVVCQPSGEGLEAAAMVPCTAGARLRTEPQTQAAGVVVGITPLAAQAAQAASAITVLDDDPTKIPYAIELGKKTYRNILQNLVWAFGYNALLIPVAALGLLNPMLAGVAMAFSSVSVVANALRLRWQNL